MATFPIVSIPDNLERARSARIPEEKLPKPPSKPIAPACPQPPQYRSLPTPPKKLSLKECFASLFIVVISACIIERIAAPLGKVFAIVVLFLFGYYRYLYYPVRKKDSEREAGEIARSNDERLVAHRLACEVYENKKIGYSEGLDIYERALKQYEKNIKALTKEHQANLIRSVLNGLPAYDLPNSRIFDRRNKPKYCDSTKSIRQGISEPGFEVVLKKYFGAKIQCSVSAYSEPQGRSIERMYYYPDFIYVDSDSGLHIDIEIDEPYTFEDGNIKPIHYHLAEKDTARNNWFKLNGWIVIRFAEEQVVRSPDSCCKAIARIIYEFGNEGKFLDATSHLADLEPIKQWTQIESIAMSEKNYRDSYIPALVRIANTRHSSDKCPKCNGKGSISRFRRIQNGKCFRCDGTGCI